MCQVIFGPRCCYPAGAALLLLLLLLCCGVPACVAVCPPPCLCAIDLITCSGSNLSSLPFDLPGSATRLDLSHNLLRAVTTDWTPGPLDRLTSLVLNRNLIGLIDTDAFNVTPHLLHLDLSSNQLTVLNVSIFTGLKDLEELLLFDNQIVQILPGAFRGLHSLQRLYLSGNKFKTFPRETLGDPGGVPNLTFLDLSHNNISDMPVQSLLTFSRHGRIYVQQNPLVCDDGVLALLEYWTWKRYRPLADFRQKFPCRDGSISGPPSVSQGGLTDLSVGSVSYQVEPGRWLSVPCPGLAASADQGQVVFWVTPRAVVNSSSGGPTDHAVVLSNGTLVIRGALVEDHGTYGCVAVRRGHFDPPASLEVHVVVGNMSAASVSGSTRGSEHFNTAFTTLVTCAVSIMLVLLYLYLTPCRCGHGHRGCGGCGGRVIIFCSDPEEEEESGKRRSNGKRVVFSELQVDDPDTCGPALAPAMSLGHVTPEGILKNGKRKNSDGIV